MPKAKAKLDFVHDMGAMSMVRQPIGPTTHWAENPLVRWPIGPKTHWSEDPLVRRPIGPKKCHWSENHWSKKVSLVKKPIGPKKRHWSENSGNVDYHVLSKPDTFIAGKLVKKNNKVYSFPSLAYQPLAIRNSAIKKPPAFWTRNFWTNDTFSDQWVFGPMTHFFGPMVFGPMTLFRTNGPSDQWVFGPMGRRTNGFSDQWVVGPMGCRTIETSP